MQSSRDLGLHISSKLSGDWSAANVTNLLSEPVLEHLLARWETLDPLVRARLLLSPLFLRKKDLADLHSELERLAEVGAGDRWVTGFCSSMFNSAYNAVKILLLLRMTGMNGSVSLAELWVPTMESCIWRRC